MWNLISLLFKFFGVINTISSTIKLFRARKEIENMDVKGILQSKTIWGIIISIVAIFLKRKGIEVDETGLVNDFIAAAGSILAVYGRITATKVLIGPKE